MHLKIYLVFLLGYFLISCSSRNSLIDGKPDITEYTWGTSNDIIIEEGFYHTFKKIDTVLNQLTGDTLTPIQIISDKKLVIRKMIPTSMDMKEKDGITEFVITKAKLMNDTLIYDVKNYIDQTFLILYSRSNASRVYVLKNPDVKLKETNHLQQPEFEVKGYKIGDRIDRSVIDVIYEDRFGTSITEEAVLIEDPDISFVIIGRNYIEHITRTGIPEDEIDKLIKAINKQFENEPEYEEITNGEGALKQTMRGYYWIEKDVSIQLQKTDPPVNGQTGWTLEYSNFIITNILQNYLEEIPEAS